MIWRAWRLESVFIGIVFEKFGTGRTSEPSRLSSLDLYGKFKSMGGL